MNPYTIQSGDTLSGLAAKYNTTIGGLINLNPQIKDPNKIFAGQSLNLGMGPAAGGNTTNNVITPPSNKPSQDGGPDVVGSYQYDLAHGLAPGTSSSGNYKVGGGVTTKGYVADSSGVTAEEQRLKTQLAQLGYGANDPYIAEQQRVNEQQQALLTQQLDSYERQRKEQESSIGLQFDSAIANAKDEQEKELASNVVGLARIGGYLGGSASAAGALNNLNQKHRAEIAKLENEKVSAIQTARNAINEKQYALAMKQLEAAQNFSKLINDRNKDMFNSYIQLSQENRSQSEFVLEQGNKVLDQFVSSGKTPSAEQIISISESLGTSPEVIEGLIAAKRKTIELDQQKDKTDMDIKILNVLKDIPKGQYVKIGGNTYSGLKVEKPTGDSGSVASGQFDTARKFVQDNKNLDYAALNVKLRQNFPKLTDGDISMIMNEAKIPSNQTYLPEASLQKIGDAYVQKLKSTDEAKKLITGNPTITVDKKEIPLTPAQVQTVTAYIDSKYPTGYKSMWDSLTDVFKR